MGKKKILLALAMVSALALSACGDSSTTNDGGTSGDGGQSAACKQDPNGCACICSELGCDSKTTSLCTQQCENDAAKVLGCAPDSNSKDQSCETFAQCLARPR
ncbi:MAG: hypothetical protein GMKNLPBB_02468 [Myxococcota bacterium]|nr:hypothetical protein [Myxococcota bacterium]